MSAVSEDKVFEDSLGDPKTFTSAYGLIYVNQEIAKSIEQKTFVEFN